MIQYFLCELLCLLRVTLWYSFFKVNTQEHNYRKFHEFIQIEYIGSVSTQMTQIELIDTNQNTTNANFTSLYKSNILGLIAHRWHRLYWFTQIRTLLTLITQAYANLAHLKILFHKVSQRKYEVSRRNKYLLICWL